MVKVDEEKLVFSMTSLEDIEKAASWIIKEGKNQNVWLFEGEMGAGKTTLIKEVCHQLNVIDTVSSPTFSIVNEYLTEKELSIYHFDFYRVKGAGEAVDIGALEYLESGDLCLVEWPSVVSEIIPEKHMLVQINVDEEERLISLVKHG